MTGISPTPIAGELPSPPASIHLIGIGGIGVSGLARMLRDIGYSVSGSDMSNSPVVESLLAEGFTVSIGHRAEHVRAADLVVTTAAAPAHNPELQEARRLGIPVVKRAALLGLLSRNSTLLAVAGSHGKSTTSGMAAVAFTQAGLDPTYAVGAIVPEFGTNATLGSGDLFIAEADEYDRSFLWLQPDVAIVTNIEHDHPDLFPDLESVIDVFTEFVRQIKPGGTLIACADDPGVGQLLASRNFPDDVLVTSYGRTGTGWRWQGENGIVTPEGIMMTLHLRVPGRHNQMNALAVLAAGVTLGIDPDGLITGLERFAGIGRRMEVVYEDEHTTIIDDYAHHPTEIRATIQASREAYPNRRILVIFQPHTYSRTRALLPEFASALDLADAVVLTPVYPAREIDDLGVSSESIAGLMRTGAEVGDSVDDSARIALATALPGDVILVVGAGDIYTASEILANERGRSG